MSPLYKFIADPDALQFLLRGLVKFTLIRELNDPSELSPVLNSDQVKASLVRIRKQGFSPQDIADLERAKALAKLLAPTKPLPELPTLELVTALIRSQVALDYLPYLEEPLKDIADEMSKNVGIFCLSRRIDSLPMWAHYAKNAAGLAIEFRDLGEVFAGDDTGVLRQPLPVRYGEDRSGVTFDPRSYESLFLDKFQDWSYEEEIRIVLPLSDCRKEFLETKPIYVYELPKTCIARVILGWNMAPARVEAVRKHIDRLNQDVVVVQARFTRGHVELNTG